MNTTPNTAPTWLRPVLKIAATRLGGRIFSRAAAPIDRVLLRHTQGRLSLAGLAVPTLLLITRGRRSGLERATPLMYRQRSGDFVIVASGGGANQHPAWYLNLQSDPNARVCVGGRTFDCGVVSLDQTTREEIWGEMTTYYQGYADYQKRLQREIPLVVLRPIQKDEAS